MENEYNKAGTQKDAARERFAILRTDEKESEKRRSLRRRKTRVRKFTIIYGLGFSLFLILF